MLRRIADRIQPTDDASHTRARHQVHGNADVLQDAQHAHVRYPFGAAPAQREAYPRARIHALFQPRWGGQTWRVRPYLRLLNALDRRDALFYTYQPWRSGSITPLAQRPILPVFGVSFAF